MSELLALVDGGYRASSDEPVRRGPQAVIAFFRDARGRGRASGVPTEMYFDLDEARRAAGLDS